GRARRVYFCLEAMPIRKRHDRWEVRVQIDGRRIEETLPAGATRADAKQVEARYRRSLVDQRVGRKPQRTIADALDEWEATGERSRDLRLTREQVRKLMSKAEPRLADFVLFLALTGLRRSEALRLTPDDIVNGCVRVDTRSKSARLRMVPLAPEAAKIARRAI